MTVPTKRKLLQGIIGHLSEAEALLPHSHPLQSLLKSQSGAIKLQQCDLDRPESQQDLLDLAFGLFESSVQHPAKRQIPSVPRLDRGRTSTSTSIHLVCILGILSLLHRMSVQNSSLESQHQSFLSNYYKIPKSPAPDAASNAIAIDKI